MFLLGVWKNFDDLEESLSLQELDFILKEKRERDKQRQFFEAAIQGIDLAKEDKNETTERLEEVKRRAQLRLAGSDEEEITRQEFAEFGFGYKSV